eukprot:scaffold15669_cov34-Tisochrysis_lutea.AAC.1
MPSGRLSSFTMSLSLLPRNTTVQPLPKVVIRDEHVYGNLHVPVSRVWSWRTKLVEVVLSQLPAETHVKVYEVWTSDKCAKAEECRDRTGLVVVGASGTNAQMLYHL